jgi:hypothetical protein
MAIDYDLLNLATTQFSTATELLLQQRGSKMRGTVREGAHVGKQASPVNQISAIQMKAPQGRFAPKSRTPNVFTRRWVFPTEFETDQYEDSFDALMTLIDPKGEYAENVAYACGRAYDDALILAATGNSTLGTDQAAFSTEQFSTANFQIASDFSANSVSVGLTVAKLIEARRIFRHYHVDLEVERPTLVIGSQQEADLLNQVEVVSTEFNDRPVLQDGMVRRFLGFDVIVSERLPTVTDKDSKANTRGCLAYVRSGLYLGVWMDLSNRASIRNDLSGEPWDLNSRAMFGATRTQPGKVLQICAADTTGADITP